MKSHHYALATAAAVALYLMPLQPAVSQQAGKEKAAPMKQTQSIPGYDYGDTKLTTSPITAADLALLKKTLLWTDEDDRYLRLAGDVLENQVDAVLDVWYGYVGAHPHLLKYFSDAKGVPNTAYLGAVRQRFGQWILDICRRPHDQAWLNYQYEIALRHHRSKKNRTDKVDAVEHIGQRYLIAFIYPITATIKPFLAKKGHSAAEVDAMHNAWFKAVTLQVTLWTYPYANAGDF